MFPLFKEFNQAGEEFFLQFIEKKKDTSFLDIEDLLLFSLALLRENPETARAFSEEWDYWLIDEYQDTSWIQEQIIQRINDFKKVFCVGDPAQSIYLFRGADPYVFKRRERALDGKVKILEVNRRSSSSLVYFYNDFFPEDRGFMRFKPLEKNKTSSEKPAVFFFTYEKSGNRKYNPSALKALYHYIEKLKAEGAGYADIAVLSSKNNDLLEIASYLRNCNLPLMLYSSKNFAHKRLILDALFLLKFLINPYDDTNLKALLRTPYFRLSDQELADSSSEHFEVCKKKRQSFWSFVKEKFSDRVFVKFLISSLVDKQGRGLVKSFEKALMDSGLMELSYFQDPTGSSSANLWKLISLLNESGSQQALELFYSLMAQEDEDENVGKEASSCEDSEFVELMTIHKSKGLEFKHVIVMDFSIADSALRSRDHAEDMIIFDETKGKMAFAVPIGGRDKKKAQSYAHKVYIKRQQKENLLEKDRLFYVAMTRAKQSLALFIPNTVPQKNSWLDRVCFFKEFSINQPSPLLLEEQYDEKDETKLKSWKLNEGFYKTDYYGFCIQSSESISESRGIFFDFEVKEQKKEKKDISTAGGKGLKTVSIPIRSESFSSYRREKTEKLKPDRYKSYYGNSLSGKLEEGFATDQVDSDPVFGKNDCKTITLTGGLKYFKTDSKLKTRSSINFVEDTGERKTLPEKNGNSFSLSKAKNTLFKTHLGNHLHFFLQRLSYQSFDQVQFLVKSSFLTPKDQEQIQQALAYTAELKAPPLSLFLKTGFAEWPFKIQKDNILLQGQIDLWSWDDERIHLFDYKSSKSQSEKAKKQLIFYSWILDQMYHPKKIWMYEVYPFDKAVFKSFYNRSHKGLFEKWLQNNK